MTDHYAQTSLLLPMIGANNGTEFMDWSPVPKTVTRAGGIVTSTAQSKFYGSSARFDGIDDRLTLPADFLHMGADPWLIDGWILSDDFAATRGVIGQRMDGATSYNFLFFLNTSSKLTLAIGSSDGESAPYTIGATASLLALAWHHFEISRTGDTFYLFLDGGLQATQAVSAGFVMHASIALAQIGAYNEVLTGYYKGYMQDLRVVKGVGGHTASFAPPSRRLGTISNTNGAPITDENGAPAQRKIFAVPRSYFGAGGVGRIWSTESDADGRYELWAPAGVEHSRIIVAQDSGSPGPADPVLPDLIDRVIPA